MDPFLQRERNRQEMHYIPHRIGIRFDPSNRMFLGWLAVDRLARWIPILRLDGQRKY